MSGTPERPDFEFKPGISIRRHHASGSTSGVFHVTGVSVDGSRIRGTINASAHVTESAVNVYPDWWELVDAGGTPERTAAGALIDAFSVHPGMGGPIEPVWETYRPEGVAIVLCNALGISPVMSVDRLRAVLEAGERALALKPAEFGTWVSADDGMTTLTDAKSTLDHIRGGSDVQHQDGPQ